MSPVTISSISSITTQPSLMKPIVPYKKKVLLDVSFLSKQQQFSKQKLNRLWVMVLQISTYVLNYFKLHSLTIENSLSKHHYARRMENIYRLIENKLNIQKISFFEEDAIWLKSLFSHSSLTTETAYYGYKYCTAIKHQQTFAQLADVLEKGLLQDFYRDFEQLPPHLKKIIYTSICFSEGKQTINAAFAIQKLKENPRILLHIQNHAKTNILHQMHDVYAYQSTIAKDLALLSYYQETRNDSNSLTFIEKHGSQSLKNMLDNAKKTQNSQLNDFIDYTKKQMAHTQFHQLRKNMASIFHNKIEDDVFYEATISRLTKQMSLSVLNEPITVAMVGTEFTGLIKQGGLAEALEGMTKGFLKLNPNNKARLIFPKYDKLPAEILEQMKEVESDQQFIDQNGKKIPVYKMVLEGIECFFIDHETFELSDDNPNIYGPTDKEQKQRFINFTELAAQVLYQMKGNTVIHLHDWHVAGIALKIAKDHPKEWAEGGIPPIVFTYHNNSRSSQGRTNAGVYNYDPTIQALKEAGIIDNPDGNLFVETIEKVEMVTTVSKHFAAESQDLHFGEGISFIMKKAAKEGKLCGITNGTNVERWNPETDKNLKNWLDPEDNHPIDLSFGVNSPSIFQQKQLNKVQFKKWLKKHLPEGRIVKKGQDRSEYPPFAFDETKPLMTYIGRFDSSQKGIDRLRNIIRSALNNGAQFVLMGSQEDPEATIILDQLEKEFPTDVVFIRDYKDENGKFHFQEGNLTRPGIGSVVRAATDMVVVPSKYEPCGLVQIEMFLFGALAIGASVGGLVDTIITDPDHFNGYLFDPYASSEKGAAQVIANALTDWISLSQAKKDLILKRVMQQGKMYGWNTARHGFSPAEQLRFTYEKAIQRISLRNSSKDKLHFDIEPYLYQFKVPQKNYDSKKLLLLEEQYLQEYYFGSISDEDLENMYYALPEHLRVQLPAPHSKRLQFELHKELGAILEGTTTNFAVDAPSANTVTLKLYNSLEKMTKEVPMTKDENGRWTTSIDDIKSGQRYRYCINGQEKLDPFGLEQEKSKYHPRVPPYSIVRQREYPWTDQNWGREQVKEASNPKPMSIYEVHPVAWKKKFGRKPLNYRELAVELVKHCKENHFTHIELMGILEHPHLPSMGYQATGFFAPNSSLGSIDDFKYLINHLHENGLGVILDWIPNHFANDEYALSNFDGTNYFDLSFWKKLKGLFTERGFFSLLWGVNSFDFSKRNVREFLISNAVYWLKEMHIDGLRVDAVRSILGSENPAASKLFMREFNTIVHTHCQGAITIAEETTGSIIVSKPIYEEGLGFDMKWNMAWMHFTNRYFSTHPSKRHTRYEDLIKAIEDDNHHKMVLAISHDETKTGKNALINKIEGLTESEKFENVRAMLSFMMCVPGKKLNCMGNEFGNRVEWDKYLGESDGLGSDQAIMNDEISENGRKLSRMLAQLNEIYQTYPAFWEKDNNGRDLEWIEKADKRGQLVAYRRKDLQEKSFACFHNFAGSEPREYRVEIAMPKNAVESSKTILASDRPAFIQTRPKEIFNSDHIDFGGMGRLSNLTPLYENGRLIAYTLTIPPLSTVMIQEPETTQFFDQGLNIEEALKVMPNEISA